LLAFEEPHKAYNHHNYKNQKTKRAMPIPLLYFQNKGAPLSACSSSFSAYGDNKQKRRTVALPAELLATILNDHASFGDLARMANVQKAYSTVLVDSVRGNAERTWKLARALLDGTDGLAPNTNAALKLLLQLVEVPIDPLTHGPVWTRLQHLQQSESEATASAESEPVFTPNTPFAARAMVELAHLHLQGVHPAKSQDAGLAWLKAAFYAGDINAANNVAVVYEYGLYGVEIDVVAAAQWLERAAQAGHTESMAELGLCYELGCGVEVNDQVAMEWYVKAAEAGHVTAKYSVGEAFEEARGVPQSDAEACLWYYRAALEGDEDSLKALRRLHDIARIVVPGVSALLNE
jgi:TPR repeat protein